MMWQVVFAFLAIAISSGVLGYVAGALHAEWVQHLRDKAHRRTIEELQRQLSNRQ